MDMEEVDPQEIRKVQLGRYEYALLLECHEPPA
jgi:hypothetical protein